MHASFWMELYPNCHNKVENEHSLNSECGQEELKVDPLRFLAIPINHKYANITGELRIAVS